MGLLIPTVGVDPGGRETGVVVRYGESLLWAALVLRCSDGKLPDPAYLDEVHEAVGDAWARAVEVLLEAGREHPEAVGAEPVVAVEGLAEPSGFDDQGERHPIGFGGLMGTSMVFGSLLGPGGYPDAVVVPPAGHGSAPLAAYPEQLVGPLERAGRGKRRHLRSAWDIAHAGYVLARTAARAGR